MNMSAAISLLSELEKSAFAGDPSARLVLEHPITQLLLKELVETPIPTYIRFDIPHTGVILKDGKRRIIHGYASVETIDKQNELITIEALQKAWERMQKAGEKYANINLEHSNITVGKVLLNEKVKDSTGKEYWSHVDDKGLYIVAELRDDIEIADKVWQMANKNELNAYSIGGRALQKRLAQKGYDRFLQIDDLELYEVTICKRGKNELSNFEVLKSYLENGLIDQDTYFKKSEELKKSENLVNQLAFLPNLMGKNLILRDGFICQIGSSVEKEEGHDFDLLIRMDTDNSLRRHIESRLLKSIPSELWDKVDFVFGDEGGPHDTYRPIFDLALIPARSFARVEMSKSESPPTEQSSVQSSGMLKNIVNEKKAEDDKMPQENEENKAVGTPGLVGTATGPQTGGASGTSQEGTEIARLRARVKELEEALKAEKKPEEEEKAKKKYPYPEEKAEKPEEEEKAKKKPEEEEKSDEEADVEVVAALEGLEAKGKLPEGLRRWLAEHGRKVKKEDVRIAKIEKALQTLMEDFHTFVKNAGDVSKIAEKTAELLKSESPLVRKAVATPGVMPEPAPEKPLTLEDIHNMKWSEVEDAARRRQALLNR